MDYPILSSKEESLQSLSLPTVTIPDDIDFNQFSKIFLTTKLMNPLFPKKFLNLTELGFIETALSLSEQNDEEMEHSWNFNENFPNEFDPSGRMPNIQRSFDFKFPIYHIPNNNTLLISIDENFLKFSPIFANVLAKSLVARIKNSKQICILGACDKIVNPKRLTKDDCALTPPEFVTGFIGALFSEIILNDVTNFESVVVPSEGPTGFEKISVNIMDDLVDLFINEWSDEIDFKRYYDECHRYWKFDGAAMSTQSGLYI